MPSERPSRQFVSVAHVTQVLTFLALSATLVLGVRFGTLAMGTRDSTCAILQARMLVDGEWSLASPLPDQRFPAELTGMIAPLGFVALADGSGRSVPGCPAGLSVAMAAAMKLGGDPAVFLVVPLFGMLAVWSIYALVKTLATPWAGVAAASLLACSPLFLYGVIQPTTDVPAAALWMASLAVAARASDGTDAFMFRRAVGTGLLTGLAVMLQPHLFPLAAVPFLLATGEWQPTDPRQTGQLASRSRLVVAALMGMLPGVASVAWLQWRIYGSPFGLASVAANSVVGLDSLATNMVLLPWWLGIVHTPVLLLALIAPFAVRRNHSRSDYGDASIITPGVVSLLLVFALAAWALELPFGTVEGWKDARALIPALPVIVALTVMSARALVGRPGSAWRATVLLAMVAMVGGWWVHSASELGIFREKAIERKYREVGRYLAASMPPDGVVLASLPGGSIRYYANAPTLTWNAIPADGLDRLIDDLRVRGYSPLLVLDMSEREAFRARFAGRTALANLDWTARATIGRDISVYDPADRARFLAGEQIPTELISWPYR